MPTAPKTWTQLANEVAARLDRYLPVREWAIESPFWHARASVTRRANVAGQTLEERTVKLSMTYAAAAVGGYSLRDAPRQVARLAFQSAPTALGNLQRLSRTVELLYLADLRDVMAPLVFLLRDMYPQPTTTTTRATFTAPPPTPPRIVPPTLAQAYAALYLVPSAPLAVAEASYRKLATSAHRDAGGNDEAMKRLNLAIAAIRAAAPPAH